MNFFEEFAMVRNDVLSQQENYSLQVRQLIQEAEIYIRSQKWAKDITDRNIFLYSGKGISNEGLALRLEMNVNTLRSRTSKLGARLRLTMFKGYTPTELWVSEDNQVVADILANIRWLNCQSNIYEEINPYILNKVEKICENVKVCDRSDITDNELFDALGFLAALSEPTINARLAQIKPAVLSYIMSMLSNTEYSDVMSYYATIKGKMLKMPTIPERIIEECKAKATLI